MANISVYDYIKDVFTQLESVNNLDGLNNVIKKLDLKSDYEKFFKKYPSFDFALSREEIRLLKDQKIISDDNRLLIENLPHDQPLAKILFSILWKNGDYTKIQHVLDGVTDSSNSKSKNNLIFKQFGRSLENCDEPVVDQHVLRAFELYSLPSEEKAAVKKITRKKVYKNSDENVLAKYKKWMSDKLRIVDQDQKLAFKNKVDKILFIVGKKVKAKDDLLES